MRPPDPPVPSRGGEGRGPVNPIPHSRAVSQPASRDPMTPQPYSPATLAVSAGKRDGRAFNGGRPGAAYAHRPHDRAMRTVDVSCGVPPGGARDVRGRAHATPLDWDDREEDREGARSADDLSDRAEDPATILWVETGRHTRGPWT